MNRTILKLAIPNIITGLTIPLLGMVDIAIVGRLGVDYLIGALAIGTTIFNFIYWNFAFLRMGTSGLAAQAFGARNFPKAAAVLVRSLSVALLIALLLLLFQRILGTLTLSMMKGSPQTMQRAAEYFYARIWAAPATLSLFVFQGWFIGLQNSRFPMFISIVLNILNIAFSLWFVFGLKMGMVGVAWGTVVAQYGSLGVALWLTGRYYRRVLKHIDLRSALDLKPMLHFFAVNRDIFLRTFCIVVVYTFFTSASSGMGDTLLAVNTLLMQLFTIFSYMMDGFAFAAESLIGRFVGARNPYMIRRYLKALLAWSAGVALFNMLVYIFFWEDLLKLFTESTDILATASQYVGWVVIVPLLGFAPFLIDGALIGATATRIMRNSVFLSTVAFFATYYGLLGPLGNNALWLAFMVFLVLRGVLQYVMTGGLKKLI